MWAAFRTSTWTSTRERYTCERGRSRHVVEMAPCAHRFSMGVFVLGAMLSMYVVFSPFALASGNGLSPLALATIVTLLVGGSALGLWADRRSSPPDRSDLDV